MRVGNQKRYDETFREEALVLLKRSDRTLNAVAADLGLHANTLRYWYKADVAKKGKKPAGAPAKPPASESVDDRLARLERENAALKRKVDELEMDRAILKKAAAFFAKESE